MKGLDRISLEQLDFYGYHGVFPEENRLGQRFVVDLDLFLDLREAGLNDDIALSVNYAEVCASVQAIIEGKPHKLLESLAENVASTLLETYTKIKAVQVKISKPHAPIPVRFSGVSVTVFRERDAR